MAEEKEDKGFSDFYGYASPKPQQEKSPEKPKEKKSYERKPKPAPVALKTCNVRFENALVELVKDQPVIGLTSQELKYLKAHRFVK